MNDLYILYFLTFYLMWSLLFVPLFIKVAKKDISILVNKKDALIFHQIIDSFTWQRCLFEYVFLIKNKKETKNAIKQMQAELLQNENFVQISIILGRLFIARSLLLIPIAIILTILVIIGVVGFGSIKKISINLLGFEKYINSNKLAT